MTQKILLADDSVTIQKVVELTFMDQDYEVVATSDGDSALAKLDEIGPNLVIADVHMPGANGYEVAKRCQEVGGIPVLLLVGTFEPFDDDEYRASGADAYLKKPFDSQDLLQRVEELLSGTGAADEDPAADSEVDAPSNDDAAALEADDADAEGSSAPAESLPTDDTAADADDETEVLLEPELEDIPTETLELDEDSSAATDTPPSPWSTYSGGADAEVAVADAADDAAADDAAAADDIATETTEAEDNGLDEVSTVGEPIAATPEEPTEDPNEEPAVEAAADDDTPAEPSPAEDIAAEPAVEEPAQAASNGRLDDDQIERIARRVAELIAPETVREIAWEVVPDLAEVIIKERLRELESQVE